MQRKFLLHAMLPLLSLMLFGKDGHASSAEDASSQDSTVITESVDPPDEMDTAKAVKAEHDSDNTDSLLSQTIDASDQWYRKSYAAYEKGKYAQALVAIEKAIAAYPGYRDYYELKAYIHIKLEAYSRAIEAVDSALNISPDDPELFELKANCYDSLNNPGKALEFYRKMFEFRNNFDGNQNARWYNNYTFVLSQQGMADELIGVYQAYLKLLQDGETIEDDDQYSGDIHFYASLAYRLNDNDESQMLALNLAIEKSPDFSGYYLNRGSLFHDMKKTTEALADYSKGIRLGKKLDSLYYNRGIIYIELENYKAALDDFLQAGKHGKNDEDLYLMLGNAYRGAGNHAKALEAYQQVQAINPQNVKVQNNIANLYEAMGRPDDAKASYQQAAAATSSSEVPLYNLANTLMRENNFHDAIPLLQKALQAKSDFIEAYNQLGICYEKTSQYALALDIYDKVLAINPDYAIGYVNRASVHQQMQEPTLAKSDYLNALKHDPEQTIAYYLIAKLYQDIDIKIAAQYFTLAVEAGVDAVEFYIDYSAFLLEQGNHQAALRVSELGLIEHPKDCKLSVNLANAFGSAGEYGKQEAVLKKLIASQPANDSAYYNLGNYYFLHEKNYTLAEQNYIAAIKNNPVLVDAYLNLASVYADSGQQAMAYETYAKLIQKAPDNYEVYYNRGVYQLRSGRTLEAGSDFEKSFSLMDEALLQKKGNAYALSKLQSEYSLLKAQVYQLQKNYPLANESFANYFKLHADSASAITYSNYAYSLLETSDIKMALLYFEKSRELDRNEIDSVIGLIVTQYLLSNKAEVSRHKATLSRDFSPHKFSQDLLRQLESEGYEYTDTLKRLWADIALK